jgi:hypothetical protein
MVQAYLAQDPFLERQPTRVLSPTPANVPPNAFDVFDGGDSHAALTLFTMVSTSQFTHQSTKQPVSGCT